MPLRRIALIKYAQIPQKILKSRLNCRQQRQTGRTLARQHAMCRAHCPTRAACRLLQNVGMWKILSRHSWYLKPFQRGMLHNLSDHPQLRVKLRPLSVVAHQRATRHPAKTMWMMMQSLLNLMKQKQTKISPKQGGSTNPLSHTKSLPLDITSSVTMIDTSAGAEAEAEAEAGVETELWWNDTVPNRDSELGC